jgi:hypothetical protein
VKPGILWLSWTSLVLLACSDQRASAPEPAGPEPEAQVPAEAELTPEEIQRVLETVGEPVTGTEVDAPVYCGLRTRDHELWLLNGPEGPLYTVKSLEGKVLAERIDAARLGRDFPDLHSLLHGAVDLIDVDDR